MRDTVEFTHTLSAERTIDQLRVRLHEGRAPDSRKASDDDLARHQKHRFEADRDER